MRWSVVAFAALLLPLPALGQEPVVTDDAGDQEVQYVGVDSPLDSHAEIDLLWASFVEQRDSFVVRLGFSSLETGTGSSGGAFGGDVASLRFAYEGKPYSADFYHYRDLDGAVQVFGYLSEYDAGRDAYAVVEAMDVEVDTEDRALVGTFARDAVHGPDGAPVNKGGLVTGFWAESYRDVRVFSNSIPAPAVESAYDRMPDEGVAPSRVVMQDGMEQSGHARLWSDEAFRISNGEATTFLYALEAGNQADRRDTFSFSVRDTPAKWTVTFPEERVRIDAESSVQVPVLVTVPFNHEHGKVQSMVVEATSRTDPASVGRIELGVRYTAVPQPAGHHNTLYIHSGENHPFLGVEGVLDFQDPAYMNTVEDYEHDTDIATSPRGFSCTSDGVSYTFHIDLVPGIGMGLDFDLDGTGVFEGEITAQIPSQGTRVSGELHYLPGGDETPAGDGDETVVAVLDPSETAPMEQGETRSFSLLVSPTARADYVKHVPDSVFRFDLTVHDQPPTSLFGCSYVSGQEPLLEPGAWLRLPLEEYHDDVEGYFQAASGIDLYTMDPQRRLVNPGATALFNVTAENTGSEDGVFDLELAGSEAAWATLLEGDRLRLGRGEVRDLHIAVAVPADATQGTLADLTLHATAEGYEQARSVVRLVAEVDTEAEHPDDTAAVQALAGSLQAKESPAPGLAFLVALALMAGARRRGGRPGATFARLRRSG